MTQGEINTKEQRDALPDSTKIEYSFGWNSRSIKEVKRGNRILGQVYYLDSETGEWVSRDIQTLRNYATIQRF